MITIIMCQAVIPIHFPNAYGNIILNKNEGSIYVYGLSGPEVFKRPSGFDGFFVQKFDLKGNIIWKNEYNVTAKLKGEGYFTVNAAVENRNIIMRINADNSLSFHIWFKEQVHSHLISSTGELKDSYFNEFGDDVNLATIDMCLPESIKLKSLDYLNSFEYKKRQKTYYKCMITSKGEVLIHYLPSESLINLLFFKAK